MSELAWTVREALRYTWAREYVSLEPPEGVDAERLSAVNALSFEGVVEAAQYDAETQRLITCLELAPFQEITLRPSERTPPETGLTVQPETSGEATWMSNRFLAVRLPHQPTVQDAGQAWRIEGPLRGLVGPDGRRRTGSWISLPHSRFLPHDRDSLARYDPVRDATDRQPPTVEIRLIAQGPVFSRWRYILHLADGGRYRCTIELRAEEPFVRIHEAFDTGRDGHLVLELSESFPADLYGFAGFGPTGAPSLAPIPHRPERIGSLAPHHSNAQTFYPWLSLLISDAPQGSFTGIGATGIEPKADVISVMGHQPWRWRYPSDVAPQFHADAAEQVSMRGSVEHGERAWLLFVQDQAAWRTPHRYELVQQSRSVANLGLWHRKLNDLPLDEVRRWDLVGESPEVVELPRSVLSREELRAKRAEVFRDLADHLPPPEGHGNAALNLLYLHWAMDSELEDEAIWRLGGQVLRVLEEKLAIALNEGFVTDAMSPVSNRVIGPLAVFYEACVAGNVFSEPEEQRARSILLLFGYASAGDALFPCSLNYRHPADEHAIRNWSAREHYSDLFGTPNFQTDVYFNLGLIAAVFREHRESPQWLTWAAEQFDQQLDLHFHPGGVYEESPLYFGHLFHNLLILASVLRRAGQRDFFADPRVQRACHCLVDYLGSPHRNPAATAYEQDRKLSERMSPTEHPVRHWPAIGDTGHNCVEPRADALLAHAAWEVRPHDPDLSEKLLAAWAEADRPLIGHGFPSFEPLYLEEPQRATRPVSEYLHSRRFTNVGVMMRAHVGQPDEWHLFVRSGRAAHHWGYEQGHLTLGAHGSLLVPDFGYHGTESPDGAQIHGWPSWLHNVVTFGPGHSNDGYGIERRREEPRISLGEAFDYVEADLLTCQAKFGFWRNAYPRPGIEHTRHVLFAKGRYVLVWDRIAYSQEPSQLRIHALAQSATVDGPEIRFRGHDGVDLRARLILPNNPEIHLGRVGPQVFGLIRQRCELDYLWLLQPLPTGARELDVEAGPHRVTIRGVGATGDPFTDHVLHHKGDGDVDVTLPTGNVQRLAGRFGVLREQPEHGGTWTLLSPFPGPTHPDPAT